MAIITDPDQLNRFEVIYGTKTQKVSIYPLGAERGDTGTYANDAYFVNTSTIARFSGTWGSMVNTDVVVVLEGDNAGHYYVNNAVSTTQAALANIDLGESGAQHTALTNTSINFDTTVANVSSAANTITLTAHGYVPGDAVILEGGAPPTGLSSGTVYYVIVDDANTIRLATTYTNSLAGTGVNITAPGTGTANLHERVLMKVCENGASTIENINGNPTGGANTGNTVDGATLQAVYSMGKEEWRNDIDLDGANYNDDLIRHEFPFEAITSEQFEIGGGASHLDWGWFNEYTRKKVRTAGWAEKVESVSSTNDFQRQAGVVTLGSLDADTQVYYQQTSAVTAPQDFTFLGVVNEAVQIYLDNNQDGTPDNNFQTYLKLFARKKGKTYVQSEIADIGVSTIQTIVNRFPLSHADDAAIVATDGEINALAPYKENFDITAATGSDGSKTAGEYTFTSSGSTFQTDGVVAGDTLRITSNTEQGYYTINAVSSETVLQIKGDFEKVDGWDSTETLISFQVSSPYRTGTKATGSLSAITTGSTSATNTFEDLTEANFVSNGVITGDVVWIQESGARFGLYPVVSVTDADTLIANTIDNEFGAESNLDYNILVKGMYLEYKKEAANSHGNSVNGGTVTEVIFDDANPTYQNRPTIQITGENFDTGIDAGSIVEVSNSSLNDGSYTVLALETANIVSLISTDVLVDETDSTPNTVVDHFEGFKRTVGGVTYAFNWKVLCNGTNLANTYQYIQHELRQTTDIDYGEGVARGDITDLLMSFATPTGTGINMYFDGISASELNNITIQDHSGVNRNFPFTAAGSLTFNTNLTGDTDARYWLFFTNDDTGDNLGRDYGTKDAIIVKDADNVDIQGDVSAQASIDFTYAFDSNIQRGSASANTVAPVTLVALGLQSAQFVITSASITRATGITISAVAALERNYLNA